MYKTKYSGSRKRCAAWAVLAAMLVTGIGAVLTGCSESGAAEGLGGEQANDRGRYAEQQMEMPKGLGDAEIFQLTKENEVPVLYALEGVSTLVTEPQTEEAGSTEDTHNLQIRRFEYTDGSWRENTFDWLGSLELPQEVQTYQMKVIARESASYLYYRSWTESGSMGNLFVCTDGQNAADITPAQWKEENPEYQSYDAPMDVNVTEDGDIVALFYTSVGVYSKETGEQLALHESTMDSFEKVYTIGNQYLLLQRDENYLAKEVEVFEVQAAKTSSGAEALAPAAVYPFTQATRGSLAMDTLADGTIYIGTPDGFFEKKTGADEFVKVVDGAHTSFSMLNMWCENMVAFANGTFMAWFDGDNGQQTLMVYEYDETLLLEPENELTVYSLYDNSTLQQAAALFSKANPDTAVKLHVAFPNVTEGEEDMESALENEQKRFNSALISGEGEDVIVLDGMDAKNLIAKGVFTDLSEEIYPRKEDGTLMANIVEGSVQKDGSIPCVPLRFAMDLLVTREGSAADISDMKTLAQWLAQKDTSVFGARTSDDLVDMFAPYFTEDIVKDKQLDKEALLTHLTYLKQIADNCGIVEDYGEGYRGYNIWEIASKTEAALVHDSGFAESMFPLSAARLVDGSFSSFESAYYPLLQMGVNQSSKQQQLAKEFVLFCLSEEVQNSDFYDGYPVNSNALATQKEADYSNYEAETDIEVGDGQYTLFRIEKFRTQEGAQLAALCKGLTRQAVTDDRISDAIKKAVPTYFSGSRSAAETVTQIEAELKMYLAE